MSELILEKNDVLPVGWKKSKLDSLSLVITKGSTPTTYGFKYEKIGINFIKVENIVDGLIDQNTINEFISDDAHNYLKRSQLKEDDILFSIAGTIGRTTVTRKLDLPANTNQAIAIIRCPWKYLNPKYVRLMLDSPILFNSFRRKSRGVGIYNLSLSDIKELVIPIPPLNEQKRIALKIEELFSLIDFQSNTLLKTKKLLVSNKKSILRNAFNGNLTNLWRKLNPSESSENMMIEIRKEREKKNLEKFENSIHKTLNLPDNWEHGTLGIITENHDGKRIPISKIKRAEIKGQYPYYGASGIIDYVNKPLFKGKYLLIGEDGANLLSRTTPIAFIADGEFWVNNHAHILKTLGRMPLEFLSYYINSIDLSEWVTGTAQPKLNQANMNKIPIPIPSISEQNEIIKIIEQEFSIVDKQIEFIKNWKNHLTLLRTSILKQAFEGKLVHQDPNDEPVEILLQKIKQEKEQLIQKQKASRSRKNVK